MAWQWQCNIELLCTEALPKPLCHSRTHFLPFIAEWSWEPTGYFWVIFRLFSLLVSLPFSIRVPSWHRALGTQHSLCMPQKSAWKGSVINTDVQRGSFNLWSLWWLLGEKQLLWGYAPPVSHPPSPKNQGSFELRHDGSKWKETFGDGERVKGEGRERMKER